ncbi:unnamed protein product [Camellia sinensis]
MHVFGLQSSRPVAAAPALSPAERSRNKSRISKKTHRTSRDSTSGPINNFSKDGCDFDDDFKNDQRNQSRIRYITI